MQTKFLEATNGERNWGKFLLMRPGQHEWRRRSALPAADGQSLLAGRGWTPRHLWMLDLQTGEGAYFLPGGCAAADLNKHRIWVCYERARAWCKRWTTYDIYDLRRGFGLRDRRRVSGTEDLKCTSSV